MVVVLGYELVETREPCALSHRGVVLLHPSEQRVKPTVPAKVLVILIITKPAEKPRKIPAIESECADRSPGTRSMCGKSCAW